MSLGEIVWFSVMISVSSLTICYAISKSKRVEVTFTLPKTPTSEAESDSPETPSSQNDKS